MKVVFVHGFLGSALNWQPIVEKMKKRIPKDIGYSFQAIDLLGHGQKSDARRSDLKLEDLAEDFLKEVGSEPFIAVAHSFGLRPVLKLVSLKSQHLPQALIVEDSSPTVSERGFEELKRIFEDVPVPFDSREAAKQALEKIFGEQSKMARFLMTSIREISPGVHSWRFNKEAMYGLLKEGFNNPMWSEWEAYPGPVYLILGGDSSFVPKERRQEMVERRKGLITESIQIAQSGHWVHADQPDIFADELSKILKNY